MLLHVGINVERGDGVRHPIIGCGLRLAEGIDPTNDIGRAPTEAVHPVGHGRWKGVVTSDELVHRCEADKLSDVGLRPEMVGTAEGLVVI